MEAWIDIDEMTDAERQQWRASAAASCDADPFAWIEESTSRGRGRAPWAERKQNLLTPDGRLNILCIALAALEKHRSGNAVDAMLLVATPGNIKVSFTWAAFRRLLGIPAFSVLVQILRDLLKILAARLQSSSSPDGPGGPPDRPPPTSLLHLPHVSLAPRLLPAPAFSLSA